MFWHISTGEFKSAIWNTGLSSCIRGSTLAVPLPNMVNMLGFGFHLKGRYILCNNYSISYIFKMYLERTVRGQPGKQKKADFVQKLDNWVYAKLICLKYYLFPKIT